MFDNANAATGLGGNGVNQTRGLEWLLNYNTGVMTATLLRDLIDPNETLYVQTQGSVQTLGKGSIFMGYGQVPKIKEYGPDGDVRMDLQFGFLPDNITSISYRAFRYEWEAVPAYDPVAVALNGVVYMSWNGATNVTGWDVYEGSVAGALVSTGTATSPSFEDIYVLAKGTKYVQVEAIIGDGGRRKSNVALVQEGVVVPDSIIFPGPGSGFTEKRRK